MTTLLGALAFTAVIVGIPLAIGHGLFVPLAALALLGYVALCEWERRAMQKETT